MNNSKPNVLIVDDNPSNIDILINLLDSFCSISVAVDGENAIEVIKKNKPDLILLDILMPKMNGYEVCRILKSDFQTEDIPIIFLSAKGDPESIRKGFSLGAVDFIIKPFTPEEVLVRVKNHIKLYKYQKNLNEIVRKQTAEIKENAKKILKQYKTDPITGLKNFVVLNEKMKEGKNFALLVLDVDNFNIFNKMYGQAFGDKLLKAIAEELDLILMKNMSLYKIESDMFVILIDRPWPESIKELSDQIKAFFGNKDVAVDKVGCKISFSIGAAKYDKSGNTMMNAEYALGIAKKKGKRFCFTYEEELEEIRLEKKTIEWINKTKELIYEDKIIPYFQPIVDLKSDEVYKYEVLARADYYGEIIPPAKFLQSAHDIGLIGSVTKNIIKKSFEIFEKNDKHLSINITERDLREEYLVEYLKYKTEEHSIEPSRITLEILENITVAHESESIIKQLHELKKMGFKIAIDDFGAENSNFSRLLHINANYIKIDSVFIKSIEINAENQRITKAIIEFAKVIDVKTVAEYVESENIYYIVKDMGIDYAQGYYLGKPGVLE